MFPIGDENEPGRGLPFVTLALIGLNVAVFVLLQEFGAENDFTFGWSAIPFEIVNGVDLVRPYLVGDRGGASPASRRRRGRSRSS